MSFKDIFKNRVQLGIGLLPILVSHHRLENRRSREGDRHSQLLSLPVDVHFAGCPEGVHDLVGNEKVYLLLLALFFVLIIVIDLLRSVDDRFEVFSEEHQHIFRSFNLLRHIYHVHYIRVLHALLLKREPTRVARVVK